MNLLVEALPTSARVGGQVYEINTDFRDCLRVILAFEDNTLTSLEKQIIMLQTLFKQPPHDPTEACKVAVRFLNGGAEASESTGPRVFSFAKDANLIFAAFKQTHGIDLADLPYYHWWKFLALFMDLGADTAFCGLVNLRRRVFNGDATKEERKAAKELGDMFSVPEMDTRTPEEREFDLEFMRLAREAEARRANG